MRSLRKGIERQLRDVDGETRFYPCSQCFIVEVERGGVSLLYEEHCDRRGRSVYESLKVKDGSGKTYVFERDREDEKLIGGKDPREMLRMVFPYKRKSKGEK